jgi:hypothetical protein
MTVSIVIPHWNQRGLLEPLIESIRGLQMRPDWRLEIVLVDNGSTDDSVALAERAGARVLIMGENAGVSRALNCGIQSSEGEFVALLNNDVELDPHWLECLVTALENSDAWFATGKMLDAKHRHRIDGAGDAICRGGTSWRLGHGREDGPVFGSSRATYFPSATAALFRRAFFDRVGLFEESFFAYLEDIDLGLRAAIAETPGLYVPRAVAYHQGSSTAGVWSHQTVEWLTCHQLLLLAKFYPTALLLRYARPIFAAQLLWATLALSRGRSFAWASGFCRGLARFPKFRRKFESLRAHRGRLAAVLRSAEKEIALVQRDTKWDTYWKWYFRLAPPLAEEAP